MDSRIVDSYSHAAGFLMAFVGIFGMLAPASGTPYEPLIAFGAALLLIPTLASWLRADDFVSESARYREPLLEDLARDAGRTGKSFDPPHPQQVRLLLRLGVEVPSTRAEAVEAVDAAFATGKIGRA